MGIDELFVAGKGQRRLAVVTGASSGIGYACAERFALQGWAVVCVARRETELQEAVAKIKNLKDTNPDVFDFPADANDAKALEELCKILHSHNKLVNALVLSAGSFGWDNEQGGEAETLLRSNFESKVTTLEVLTPALAQGCAVVAVGSQAGKPNFVEDLEAREGKGAADKEKNYIACMQRVREWALAQKAKGTTANNTSIRVELVEPGLVDSPLARQHFASIVSDWTKIPPAALVAVEVWSLVQPAVDELAALLEATTLTNEHQPRRTMYWAVEVTPESQQVLLAHPAVISFLADHPDYTRNPTFHTTLVFVGGSKDNSVLALDQYFLGFEGAHEKIRVNGLHYDAKDAAFSVSIDLKCNNKHPHITLALTAGTPAVYSNTMLDSENTAVECTMELDGVVVRHLQFFKKAKNKGHKSEAALPNTHPKLQAKGKSEGDVLHNTKE